MGCHLVPDLLTQASCCVCRVGDVMTEEPVVVRAETNMATAARMLLEQRMRRLPVVDADGRLVGILTRRDVLKAALKARKARRGRWHFTRKQRPGNLQ